MGYYFLFFFNGGGQALPIPRATGETLSLRRGFNYVLTRPDP